MTNTESPARVLALVLGLAAIAGCGSSDGFERFPVEGKVILDGAPLKSGTITFIAKDQGASSSTAVSEGAFRLGASDGLSPGAYRVEVYSIQPTGKQIPNPDDPQTLVDEMTSLIPTQYNAQSQLHAEIPPGGPKEPLAFTLSGVPKTGAKR